eukprot:scaffold118560_cov60-Phaeocystis_antarctica.AAC.1
MNRNVRRAHFRRPPRLAGAGGPRLFGEADEEDARVRSVEDVFAVYRLYGAAERESKASVTPPSQQAPPARGQVPGPPSPAYLYHYHYRSTTSTGLLPLPLQVYYYYRSTTTTGLLLLLVYYYYRSTTSTGLHRCVVKLVECTQPIVGALEPEGRVEDAARDRDVLAGAL